LPWPLPLPFPLPLPGPPPFLWEAGVVALFPAALCPSAGPAVDCCLTAAAGLAGLVSEGPAGWAATLVTGE
jgi:hypothetical protein